MVYLEKEKHDIEDRENRLLGTSGYDEYNEE